MIESILCVTSFIFFCSRDTLIVVTINAGASIFAGFVTFALIGSIAHETNMAVEDLVGTGNYCIRISYEE